MSGTSWLARHRLVILAALAFVTVAPAPLFALPLAALLVATSLRTTQEWVTALAAGAVSLVWLASTGDLPDQLVRAGAVIATGVFVTTTRLTRTAVIHRALVAVSTAAVAATVLLLVVGSSWNEAQWWAEYRAGYIARLGSQIFWAIGGSQTSATQVTQTVDVLVRLQADYFPALGVLRILAGLALAVAIYQRVAVQPYGPGLAKFRSFRFTQQLGWAAIVALLVVLLPKLAVLKLGATNVLLVLAALYALRGAAVVAFGLQLITAGRGFFIAFFVIATIFMLPVVIAGAIILGLVDSGLDLRRRWVTPPTE